MSINITNGGSSDTILWYLYSLDAITTKGFIMQATINLTEAKRLPEHQARVNELYAEMVTFDENLDYMYAVGEDISLNLHICYEQKVAEFNRYADMTTEEWKTHNA